MLWGLVDGRNDCFDPKRYVAKWLILANQITDSLMIRAAPKVQKTIDNVFILNSNIINMTEFLKMTKPIIIKNLYNTCRLRVSDGGRHLVQIPCGYERCPSLQSNFTVIWMFSSGFFNCVPLPVNNKNKAYLSFNYREDQLVCAHKREKISVWYCFLSNTLRRMAKNVNKI